MFVQQHFINETNVATLTFQARDWFMFIRLFQNDSIKYEDWIYQLKQEIRTTNASGNTLVTIEDIQLGSLLFFHFNLRLTDGKEISKTNYNRIETVLHNLEGTYPDIVIYFTDLSAYEIEVENRYQVLGRKFLRGKLE